MKIRINNNKRCLVIGDYDKKTNTFTKIVYGSLHKFRVLNSWGIDSEYFNNFLVKKNALIKIYDKETGLLYSKSAKELLPFIAYYHFKENQLDNKTQVFFKLEYFKIENYKEKMETERRIKNDYLIRHYY
jgi:hypothetical protein